MMNPEGNHVIVLETAKEERARVEGYRQGFAAQSALLAEAMVALEAIAANDGIIGVPWNHRVMTSEECARAVLAKLKEAK
ncbi:hypothetical protein KGP36_02470 [Patescibacteria group bacterium]|nr:hypothetical protein [Patescibacteria group bacterium]